MNLTGCEIFQYRLPFKRSLTVLNQPLACREGVIIRLIAADGFSGIGEVAPLPGLSEELLKKAIFQVKSLRRHLSTIDIPNHLSEFNKMFARGPFEELCPSVRFGIEMAVLHLMAQAQDCLPAEVLGCSSFDQIHVAGLLQGTPDEIKSQVGRLMEDGFDVFKLKIGSKNIPLDVKKVQLVRDMIGPKRTLRLDANRTWSLIEATAFCHNAGRANIEFIEEPLKDIHELERFAQTAGWPVALDESIGGLVPDSFMFPECVKCIVLKPTVVGGIMKTLEWIGKAKKDHREVVISSAFESGVGARMLANLAALIPLASGLGTEDWLAQDLLPPLRSQGSDFISRKSLRFQWEDINIQSLIPISE